jgi:hypothetical protein
VLANLCLILYCTEKIHRGCVGCWLLAVGCSQLPRPATQKRSPPGLDESRLLWADRGGPNDKAKRDFSNLGTQRKAQSRRGQCAVKMLHSKGYPTRGTLWIPTSVSTSPRLAAGAVDLDWRRSPGLTNKMIDFTAGLSARRR